MAEPFDLGALKRKAEQATPGEWGVSTGEHGRTRQYWDVVARIPRGHAETTPVCEMAGERDDADNARYIVSASPYRLLALHAQLLAFRQWLVEHSAPRVAQSPDGDYNVPQMLMMHEDGALSDALEQFDRRVSLDAREGE